MKNKLFFVSDIHLGVPDLKSSQKRERMLIDWIESIEHEAKEIIILGDLFDFWFEYNTVVPKGFVRILGKLAHLNDNGTKITVFTGNHDIWMFDYFEKELGIEVIRGHQIRQEGNKKLFLHHGDGLGPGDHSFKFMKKVFTNKFCQFLFNWLHPDLGIKLALFSSHKSRESHKDTGEDGYKGDDKEFLYQFVKDYPEEEKIDYFIFGHRHILLEKQIGSKTYVNLGDWLSLFTYAEFDGQQLHLKEYKVNS